MVALHMRAEAQGGGVGRALFHAACAWLAGQGCRSMIVWVLDGNPAVAFYEHLGGTPAGRQAIGLGIGDVRAEEVAFRWALGPPGTDPVASSGQVSSAPF